MVYCEKMGLGFGYARSTGSRRNRPWKDGYLSGSRYDMEIADGECCCGVAADNFVVVYPCQMGEDGTEQLTLNWL